MPFQKFNVRTWVYDAVIFLPISEELRNLPEVSFFDQLKERVKERGYGGPVEFGKYIIYQFKDWALHRNHPEARQHSTLSNSHFETKIDLKDIALLKSLKTFVK